MAPGKTARRAALRPARSSLTMKRTPRMPRAIGLSRKPRQWISASEGSQGDAEYPPPVRPDADGGEPGGIADHTALAPLFGAGIEKEIGNVGQRPAAPGR